MPRRSHLRSLLDALLPADAQELEHKTRVAQLLQHSPAPFSRAQFTPGHVTASAFVVDQARESILLILHGKLGRWLQPGGHVEADDSDVIAAAQREVREEVGLDRVAQHGLLDVDVHRIPALGSQPAHEHFDVRFLFSVDRAQTPIRAGSDARAVRWVSIAALLRDESDPATASDLPCDESVLRAVRKLGAGRS